MPSTRALLLADDGRFPNSSLPVLIYQDVPLSDAGARLENNSWTGTWINGIYDFPHYHSTTHEVLLVLGGEAEVCLGGPDGEQLALSAGWGLVLPAGVAHQCLSCSGDFRVMGAYPAGHHYDMMYGEEGERPAADRRIAQVALPSRDPFYGADGDLPGLWLAIERG